MASNQRHVFVLDLAKDIVITADRTTEEGENVAMQVLNLVIDGETPSNMSTLTMAERTNSET
ncbi:uncharacterized protein PG986_014685 [Apiospora aurea]|uniref:Uncharacterized protein n=1 Tax=Apiospora aurea TaxID=335848 RepID=A0ABR1PTP9_9PEZI